MGTYDDLEKCTGFDWDDGNQDKNWEKHDVTDAECEQVFFNDPLVAGADPKQSKRERRYYALGRTDAGRRLFVAFTIRKKLIRVISAAGGYTEQQSDRDRCCQRTKQSAQFALRRFPYWEALLYRLRRRERPASATAPGINCAREPGSGT